MFWERFYDLCQQIEKKPNPVGKEMGISSGIISKWKSGAIPSGENLIKLAQYFDCSIDYLVGRTDNPQAHKSANVVYGNLSNNSGIVGNVGSTISNTAMNPQTATMLETFNKLDPLKQAKVLVYADDLAKDE